MLQLVVHSFSPKVTLLQIENDHSKAQRRFASMQQLTQVMLGDLADQITIQLTGALLSYIDAASDLFARGNAAFTDFKPKLEMYKQAQSKVLLVVFFFLFPEPFFSGWLTQQKLATYLRGMKGSKSDTHSVRTGILEKLNEKKKSWTSRLFVLKYRWLLYYEGSEVSLVTFRCKRKGKKQLERRRLDRE